MTPAYCNRSTVSTQHGIIATDSASMGRASMGRLSHLPYLERQAGGGAGRAAAMPSGP